MLEAIEMCPHSCTSLGSSATVTGVLFSLCLSRLEGRDHQHVAPWDRKSSTMQKSLWAGKPLSWLEMMLQECCCKHKRSREEARTQEHEEALLSWQAVDWLCGSCLSATALLPGSSGAGAVLRLCGEPPLAWLWLHPAWEPSFCLERQCSRQVHPGHTV